MFCNVLLNRERDDQADVLRGNEQAEQEDVLPVSTE
jgi:hypothetical protein